MKRSAFRLGAVEGWVVTRDGETLKTGFPDETAAVKWLHDRHSFSVDHAVRYEGYDVVRIKDGKVDYSYRREQYRRRNEPGTLNLDPAVRAAHRDLMDLSGLAWWDAMANIYRDVGPDRFRAWIVEETTPWVVRVKVIEMLAWNDHNSEWYLNLDRILRTRMIDSDTRVTPELVAESLDAMIEGQL